MSEGDILRLNRMYKCDRQKDVAVQVIEYEKQDGQLDENSSNDAQLFGDDYRSHELIEDELISDDESSSNERNSMSRRNLNHQRKQSQEALLASLKEITSSMLEHLKPLCDLKKHLKEILIKIRDL